MEDRKTALSQPAFEQCPLFCGCAPTGPLRPPIGAHSETFAASSSLAAGPCRQTCSSSCRRPRGSAARQRHVTLARSRTKRIPRAHGHTAEEGPVRRKFSAGQGRPLLTRFGNPYESRDERRSTAPSSNTDTIAPDRCPTCKSASIVTTEKSPDSNSYWRCTSCGDVWNDWRLHSRRSGGRR